MEPLPRHPALHHAHNNHAISKNYHVSCEERHGREPTGKHHRDNDRSFIPPICMIKANIVSNTDVLILCNRWQPERSAEGLVYSRHAVLFDKLNKQMKFLRDEHLKQA